MPWTGFAEGSGHQLAVDKTMTFALGYQKRLDLRLGYLLFAAALFGYPIVGNLIAVLQIESRLLSVPFRLFVGVLSLFVFTIMARMRLNNGHLLILLFWFALLLRLSFDTFIADIDGVDYALMFFIVASLAPALALWNLNEYDQGRLAFAGFIVASTGSLTSLIGSYFGIFGEFDLTELTGRLSTTVLNPVSLGYLTVSAFLCGLGAIGQVRGKARFLIAVVMVGLLFVLAQTGSKGPLLSLAIPLLMWAFRRGHLTAVIISTLALLVAFGNSPLFERLLITGEDPSTRDRITLIHNSFQQIVSSPWIGSASVELNTGYYPHNILLEAAMSFGLPFAVLFLAFLVRTFIISWRMLDTNYSLIALLFIQSLVASQLSGSLFADSTLWICLVGIQSIKTRAVRKKKILCIYNDCPIKTPIKKVW